MNVPAEWRYDLLTLGETLMRLSPPAEQRLEQARLFEVGRVAIRQLARAGWRHIQGRPTRAPMLLLEAFEQLSGSLLKFGQSLHPLPPM